MIAEYRALRGKKSWHRLFKGPYNIKGLAQHVKRGALYDFLYSNWSKVTHARDFSPFILGTNVPGKGVIRPVRDGQGLKDIASFTTTFFLGSTRAILGKFRPDEDISRWYENEVRPMYVQIYSSRDR